MIMRYMKVVFISILLGVPFFDLQASCCASTKKAVQGVSTKFADMQAAVTQGAISVVQQLVEAGYSVDAIDAKGKTALHYAVSAGHENIARYLVANGADVNRQDVWGLTVLADHVFEGNLLAVRLLLALGARVGLEGEDKVELLDAAHRSPSSNRQTIIKLLEDHKPSLGIAVVQ